MPFLRLTRDRRGFENTFLLHADRPGERPRLLYWYRTAPGIVLGRPPLDEDAIRAIEEQHPEVDFDWPAILALGEAMIHEEEAPARAQKRGRPDQPRRSRDQQREPRAAQVEAVEESPASDDLLPEDEADAVEPIHALEAMAARPHEPDVEAVEESEPPPTGGLLVELVGREIATRLRARYAEMSARIQEKDAEPARRGAWLRRAEALNPDTWLTPDAILEGVRNADKLFDALRQELLGEG